MEELGHERVTQDGLLVSFDVSSIFTNVPVPEAVEVIREMLRRDSKLSERTTLDADTIADLLSLCLQLAAWKVSGNSTKVREYQKGLPTSFRLVGAKGQTLPNSRGPTNWPASYGIKATEGSVQFETSQTQICVHMGCRQCLETHYCHGRNDSLKLRDLSRKLALLMAYGRGK